MVLQAEEAEDVEAVVQGNDDDVLVGSEVVTGPPAPTAGAGGKSAAMQPDHHGALADGTRGPDVEGEAVLAIGDGGGLDAAMKIDRCGEARVGQPCGVKEGEEKLAGLGGKAHRIAHADPGFGGAWCHEAVGRDRGLGIRDAEIGLDRARHCAAQSALAGLDDCVHAPFPI